MHGAGGSGGAAGAGATSTSRTGDLLALCCCSALGDDGTTLTATQAVELVQPMLAVSPPPAVLK
jgi:hypothetical protein